jgi:hypothetical protein
MIYLIQSSIPESIVYHYYNAVISIFSINITYKFYKSCIWDSMGEDLSFFSMSRRPGLILMYSKVDRLRVVHTIDRVPEGDVGYVRKFSKNLIITINLLRIGN